MSFQEVEHPCLPLLNEEFRRVLSVVCEGIAEFRHYDLKCVALSVATTRGRSRYGVWAHVIPLHYVGGKPTRRGIRGGLPGVYSFENPRLSAAHPDARYLMTFFIPRFFHLTPRERLETLVHELYHLHPSLRGDLRRFSRPHLHHGPTPALFRRKVMSLVQECLRSFPDLLKHPLMSGDGKAYSDHSRQRWAHPRQVFRPEIPLLLESSFRNLRKWVLRSSCILLGWGGLSYESMANPEAVKVKTLRSGNFYEQPSTKSHAIGSFSADATFEAVLLSPKKTWVELRAGKKKGWVPRTWVEALPASLPVAASTSGTPAAAVPTPTTSSAVPAPGEKLESFEADEVLGNDDAALAAFDAKSDKFFATREGRLYESPSRFASRFGTVVKDDELELLERSQDRKWTRVRLALTGEEGWFPTVWIRRVQESRLGTKGVHSVEAALPWGTRDHGFGLMLGYSYNILRGGFETRPRDRFELGVLTSYWLGKGLSYQSKSASLKFWTGAVLARYLGTSEDGRLSGGVELGLDYQKSILSSNGITDSTLLASLQSDAKSSALGFHMGLLGSYAWNSHWSAGIGARAHVSTGAFAQFFMGATYRF